jgi:ABC-2 type transport system permease protein
MAGVLMRTKYLVLRHSFTGTKRAMMVSGLTAGLAAAGFTIWLVAGRGAAGGDLLALAFASWVLGWVLAPMMGGGDPGIRTEHLDHLPITHRRKAVALFGAALVGIGPAVMLVAAGALVAYAVSLGVAATIVAVLAVPLLVLMVVALSNVVVAGIGSLLNTRRSAALTAVPWGVLICLTAQGWTVIAAFGGDAGSVLPPGWAHGLRIAPSGWPVAAVEAAGRGQWGVALAALAGLAAVVALAVLAWGRLLRRPKAAPVITPGTSRAWAPETVVAAVVGKELRTWGRDLVRIHFLSFALVYALTYTILPIVIGSTDYLPMTGVFAVVLAAGCSAHLHSSDGTALWQTLLAPGVERADVRGRQLAWLLVVGPAAVLLTVLGAVAHGEMNMVRWAAALLPVTLGAGAGLMLFVSVYVPIRMTDPHRRGSNPGQDGGSLAALVWLVLPVVAVASAPVITLLVIGQAKNDPLLQWAGTPAGIAIGALLAWILGRMAYRRLAARGPELLAKVGTG